MPHNVLNPKLWNPDCTLREEVRDKILEIVDYFEDCCKLDLNILDVQLVGSNASFNYSETSDLDVHIIINYEDVCEEIELVTAYLMRVKSDFNKKYDISIHGVEIEMYIQDVKAGITSNGIYSLLKGDWIKFPRKLEDSELVNPEAIKIADDWEKRIKRVLENPTLEKVSNLHDRLHLLRHNSLAAKGEYGTGNLAFKEIRKRGLIQQIKDVKNELKSQQLTLEDLTEDVIEEGTRKELINKTLHSEGNERYERRKKSIIKKNVTNFNQIDMDTLFKKGVFSVTLPVQGETNIYNVKIKCTGFLEELHKQMQVYKNFDNKVVYKTLSVCFDKGSIQFYCTCPDFKYRFQYSATQGNYNAGPSQNSNGKKIANPDDTLGSGCKHVMLALSNNSWLLPCASSIFNYVKYMEKNKHQMYAEQIYPAIYEKEYEDVVQLDMTSKDTLANETDNDDIKLGNIHQGRDSAGRFAQGNTLQKRN